MNQPSRIVLLWVLLNATFGFSLPSATGSQNDHWYKAGDPVPLFVNKVGPLNNPSETYEYFDLPFCHSDYVVKKKESFGEVLSGDRSTNALFDLKFREEKTAETLCEKELKGDEIAKFRNAVINEYYFQMYYDDLPLWGFIGKIEKESWARDGNGPNYYLFKHVQFNAFYNGNQVIEIRAFSDPNHIVDITDDAGTKVRFTYSVFWNETSTQFRNRMDKYSTASSLPMHRQIHWFSFINSIVIIVLLMALLMVLFTRHVKNDLKKFTSGDEEEDKEIGWRYIHSDVFRCPPQILLLCAMLGTGTQLLTMVFLLFALAFLGVLYPYSHGALCTSLVVIYTLTSTICGYSSASFYNQFAETGWERNILLAGVLYLGPLLLILSMLNTIAIFYGATSALPLSTILAILFLLMVVNIPLLVIGGVIGHRLSSKIEAPSATQRFPRDIPLSASYSKTPGEMFVGGLLSFSAIVLELHNTYASIWGYKIYTLPSILFVSFTLLVILVAMVSVGLIYIQLTVEDHEWWWRSIFRGGSIAIFMFGYSVWFYAKSNMSGFLQVSFFFGYNACICYGIFLMFGTISFRASLLFVRYIYRSVKNE